MERLVETMKEKEGKWNNNRKIAYHVLHGRKIQIRNCARNIENWLCKVVIIVIKLLYYKKTFSFMLSKFQSQVHSCVISHNR